MSEVDCLISYSVLAVQVSLGLFLFNAALVFLSQRWGAPWVITPKKQIQRMLELVDLKPGEKLIDLGAGDGRILVVAAKDFGAQALGYEIDPIRCLLAKLFIWRYRLRKQAQIKWKNMYDADLSDVDVIALYLTRETNQKLKSHFEANLRDGVRIVSYAFPIPRWTPTIIDDLNLIFVYEIGKTGDDTIVKFV